MLHILTLNYNGLNKLKELYYSLIKATDGIKYTWHIKDNGSSDGSENFTDDKKNINFIKYKHNGDSFAYGCNFLFRETSAQDEDYILLLNNDVVFVDFDSIKNMIASMKEDIGAVGARLLYKNTDKLQHCGVVFNSQGLPFNYRRNENNDKLAELNREFQAVTGAAFLTKAKYYKNICTTNKSKMDGMNENLLWAFDDVDAALSIRYNMNKKIVYCGTTKLFHEESATLKINPVNKLYLQHNVDYFLHRWKSKIAFDMPRYISDPKYKLI